MSHPAAPQFKFSQRWHSLGPFRIGTREAAWGANPLEALGGFHSLPVDPEAHFHSSLGTNGIAQWSLIDDVSISHAGEEDNGASIDLEVAYPEVDWAFQQAVYGWAALQYQAFARGFLTVAGHSASRVVLYTDSVLEFWINGKPFFGGDFYSFRRAPLVLDLAPGANQIDLRLLRDVRSMGGVGCPSISLRLSVQLCSAALKVVENSAVLPDVINGKLVSPYASIIARNETGEWITVVGIDRKRDTPHVELLNSSPIILAPGQSRPIPLWLSSRLIDVEEGITIGFCYIRPSDRYQAVTASSNLKFKQRSIQSPHRFTFLHPSQSVSYAILRPPSSTASEISFPVLLNLHGAGLEADSQQVRHMLDAVPELNAWVLFPTGMSPWSGDDWHVWGFADVIAAVSAIPDWIKNMNWMGPGVDIEKWVVTGHSNGGQGAWFISTHQPDKVIATVAASGYSSSENYVPYSMWREASPLVGSIVHNSRISYRHELLLANMTGIPIHQQHGAKDDNVPAYHSRLLSSLLHESGCSSQYIELPDRGHWFEGAMTTKSLQDFYSSVLNLGNLKKQIPEAFEFIIPNSGDIGSRVGIIVDQLQLPDIPGRLRVRRDDNIHTWHIETSNIHRMHFQLDYPHVQPPRVVSVDSRSIPMPSPSDGVHPMTLVRHNGTWLICNSLNWKALSGRYGRQRGSLDAILRTPSLFKIKVYSEEAFEAALQVSRNLMQYFGADAEIVVSQTDLKSAAGHIISLGQGNVIPPCLIDDFPLQICEEGIEIRRRQGNVLMRIPNQTGLASVFLRPLPDEKLELILWGCDAIGLQQAVRMVPTLTGVGQPDFIVLGNGARWKGCAGVLAMGFFDHEWQVSQASYIS